MILNLDQIENLREMGYVRVVPDPYSRACLVNYTPKVVYNHLWEEYPILLDCRGMIYMPDGKVIAKPFRRFFNVGEFPGTDMESLSKLGTPRISHKMDGSMLTLFFDPETDATRFATRGSFTSDQALAATSLWHERHEEGVNYFYPDITLVFEYVAPSNRIVVAYDRPRLVLTGMIEIDTGHEWAYDDIGVYAGVNGLESVPLEEGDYTTLSAREIRNFEGYVLHWPGPGVRVKVKLPEYVRLHRIVTGTTEHSVWDVLARNGTRGELLRDLPVDLHGWLHDVADNLLRLYYILMGESEVHEEALTSRNLRGNDKDTRKGAAAYVAANVPAHLRAAMFLYLDGKDYRSLLWRQLEPKGNAPANALAGRYANG